MSSIIASRQLIKDKIKHIPLSEDMTLCPTKYQLLASTPFMGWNRTLTNVLYHISIANKDSYTDGTQLVKLEDITAEPIITPANVSITNNRGSDDSYASISIYDIDGNDIGNGELAAGVTDDYNNINPNSQITITSTDGYAFTIHDEHNFTIENTMCAKFYLSELEDSDPYVLTIEDSSGDGGGTKDDPYSNYPVYSINIYAQSSVYDIGTNPISISVEYGENIVITDLEEAYIIKLKDKWEFTINFGNDTTKTKYLYWGDTLLAQTTSNNLTYSINGLESNYYNDLIIKIS